ncbi:MAG: YolD-like family protein [Lachnospiraceae bacterium]|nr:YolD-like family protein [Lachnospiraceae bacterium]
MSREERAKQFMPFAALKGYELALREKEKIVVAKMELSEDYKEQLDRIMHRIAKNDMVTVVYFCKGEYLKVTGMVARKDESARVLKIVNTSIPFSDIYQIEID